MLHCICLPVCLSACLPGAFSIFLHICKSNAALLMTNQLKGTHEGKVTLSLSSFGFNVFGSMQALTSLVCNSEWQRDVYIYMLYISTLYVCVKLTLKMKNAAVLAASPLIKWIKFNSLRRFVCFQLAWRTFH